MSKKSTKEDRKEATRSITRKIENIEVRTENRAKMKTPREIQKIDNEDI